MVNFTNLNNLNFLFIFVLGSVLYFWILPRICYTKECFFTGNNLMLLFFSLSYIFMLFLVLSSATSDEKLNKEIKI